MDEACNCLVILLLSNCGSIALKSGENRWLQRDDLIPVIVDREPDVVAVEAGVNAITEIFVHCRLLRKCDPGEDRGEKDEGEAESGEELFEKR